MSIGIGFDKAVWLSVLLLLGVGGCGALSAPQQGPVSTPARPLWSETEVRQHLRFFNGADVAERGTGTAGFATAAAYVAARMQEFGLQPALEGTFRLIYATPVNNLRRARLATTGADSLAFYPGVDFLPDGRSDVGTATLTQLIMAPAEGDSVLAVAPGQALVFEGTEIAAERLLAWRQAGATVVFVVGPLQPRPAPEPLPDLMIVQIAPQALARLLQTSLGEAMALLQSIEVRAQALPQSITVQIEGEYVPGAGAINSIGYMAGKQPALSQQAVLVCADLDDVGTFAGVPTLSMGQFGTGAAAMLEVARQYAFFTDYYSIPERSVMFAMLSGGRLGQAGLRAYLQQPTWALSQIRAVVYVGLEPKETPAVQAMLAPYDLPLYTISPSTDSTQTASVSLLAGRRSLRGSTVDNQAQTESGSNPGRQTPPRRSDMMDAGVQEALRMADALNNLLLREAITPASFRPMIADTLTVPVDNQ